MLTESVAISGLLDFCKLTCLSPWQIHGESEQYQNNQHDRRSRANVTASTRKLSCMYDQLDIHNFGFLFVAAIIKYRRVRRLVV